MMAAEVAVAPPPKSKPPLTPRWCLSATVETTKAPIPTQKWKQRAFRTALAKKERVSVYEEECLPAPVTSM